MEKISEREIMSKWLKNKQKLAFWGASGPSTVLISEIMGVNPEWCPICIFDSYVCSKSISICKKNIEIVNPNTFSESQLRGMKFILCLNKKEAYYEVRNRLSLMGLVHQDDFINGENIAIYGSERNPYEELDSGIKYAPWRKDREFLKLYEEIKDDTLVDIYRCYELWSLVVQSKKCFEGDLLEVGVYKGGTGALIAMASQRLQIKGTTYLVDTFEGVVKCSEYDNLYVGGEHADTSEDIVAALLKKLDLSNTYIIKGIFPDDMKEIYKNNKYRFVHIDVDVYQSGKDIFEYIWPSVVKGGIVVFDDYGYTGTKGITTLCDELKNRIDDGTFIYNLNAHGIFVKW